MRGFTATELPKRGPAPKAGTETIGPLPFNALRLSLPISLYEMKLFLSLASYSNTGMNLI